MNFKLISEHFGERVFVWGCCEYLTNSGERVRAFIPVKGLRELKHVTQTITIVAQGYNDNESFYSETFPTAELFQENNDEHHTK